MKDILKFKVVGKPLNNLPITHISFDIVNESNKTFGGVAHSIEMCMHDVCRVIVSGDDDVFNKALSLYKRGVNMFNVGAGIVVIE